MRAGAGGGQRGKGGEAVGLQADGVRWMGLWWSNRLVRLSQLLA